MFVEFDPPNSFSTHSTAINSADIIAGYFQGGQSVFHGFVRHPDGTFEAFDVPGVVNETYPAGDRFDMRCQSFKMPLTNS